MLKKLANKLNPAPNKAAIKAPQQAVPSVKNTSQGWLPIVDVNHNCIIRRDGYLVSAIRVQPVNIYLLSENEKKRKIQSLLEVLNGIDYPMQILSIARPVDLDSYIARLEEMKNSEHHFIKRRLLDGYMRQAAALATSGEALERHFYILIPQEPTKKPQHDMNLLYGRVHELAGGLSGAGLTSHVCNDQELRDILFLFSNPTQAAFERAPSSSEQIIHALYNAEG